MKFKSWLIFVFLSLGCVDPVCSIAALTEAPLEFTDITQRVAAATVSVGICDIEQIKKGDYSNVSSRGSGFFINDKGLLLTARHVIPLPLPKGKSILLFQKNPDDKSVYTTTTEIVHDWPDLDVVAIRVSEKASKAFKWLPLSNVEPKPGEEVGAFGYPIADLELKSMSKFNASSIFSRVMKSIVSNVEVRLLMNKKEKIKRKIIETQRAFSNGNSGSPLFSATDGRVVGLVNGAFISVMAIEKMEVKKGKKVEVPSLVSYGDNVSISEVLSRLDASEYSKSWQ